MAKRTGKVKKLSAKAAAREAGAVGNDGAELVRSAASLLDQELAVGVTAAKAVQQRLQKEHRIDAEDFTEALQRFQADAQELVAALNNQLVGSNLKDNVNLAQRYLAKASDLVDLTAAVVATSAELANQFIQTQSLRQDAGPPPRRKPRR